MPEGHTLYRLARSLHTAFADHVVRATSPQGRFDEGAALIDGGTIVRATSRGKHLFIEFADEQIVHVHLGLYGKFAVHHEVDREEGIPGPVGQVRLRLTRADGGAYADLRGATACELLWPQQRDAILERIGPDPLRPEDSDPDEAWRRISRSRAPIGGLLMDQSVVAGVGNVYRAEVLYRHRMHPLRPGRTLRVGQWHDLWSDLTGLLADGVRRGRIVTLRPEDKPRADELARAVGRRSGSVYVYRRTGEPCVICGRKVSADVLSGRNLFWCSKCQPTFRSRAVA